MKKLIFLVVGAVLLAATGFSIQTAAAVDVGVGIGLPIYRFSAPPPRT
ncbi:MAG: hypothetical protein ABSA46_20465 [Thermodesulfovibrionales bacterium]|jgi:hypothetical protein